MPSEGIELRLVTVTCPDLDTARRIARHLVEERLAACVNIVPGVVSVYRWKGEVAEDAEVLALAKTRADLVPAIFAAIRAIHPYDLPAVEALAVSAAGDGVAAWIEAELRA